MMFGVGEVVVKCLLLVLGVNFRVRVDGGLGFYGVYFLGILKVKYDCVGFVIFFLVKVGFVGIMLIMFNV